MHGTITLRSLLTVECPYRQQRFGRLLKVLKSANPSGNTDGGTPKLNATGKRAAPGKQNGTSLKKVKAKKKHAKEEGEEEENEDELGEEETPNKKRKSGKQSGTPKWKSIFARDDDDDDDDVVKVEEGEGSEDGAAMAKTEHELDGEVVE
jgi:hypothetical protein